jgi:DNA-directed RNA polymerase specialized sigma24 family protein
MSGPFTGSRLCQRDGKSDSLFQARDRVEVQPHAPRPAELSIPKATFQVWIALAIQALAGPPVFRGRRLSMDATQHALAKAWGMWTSSHAYFASPSHLLNWLKQTAFWTMVDWHRQDQRCPAEPLPAEGSREPTDRHSSRPKRDRWSLADRQAIWACLQRLPRTERLLLEAHFYDRLTDLELARRLYRVPEPSPAQGHRVWRLRRKALKHLRQLLQQEGIGVD